MNLADMVAISIIVVCIVLGLSGAFKWLLRLITGLLLGTAIVVCLGFLADNQAFDHASKGFFREGKLIPSVKSHVVSIANQVADQPSNPR
jgi:hypothetical protein